MWWNYICYAYSINKKTNITSTASINCHSIKVRDSYILNTVLLAIVLENNELKKFVSKNGTCYYFDHIIKLEDFDLENIVMDKKSQQNILIYDISYKTLIDSCRWKYKNYKNYKNLW